MAKIEWSVTCMPTKEIIAVCSACRIEIGRLPYIDYEDQKSKIKQLKNKHLVVPNVVKVLLNSLFNERYPDIRAEVSDSNDRKRVFSDIIDKDEEYDIIFSDALLASYAEEYLEPIDDVYAYTNEGESCTVGDKLFDVYCEYLNSYI